jgi:multidrug resistance efflux pump
MVRQAPGGESDRIDAAFNRVLAAEAQARERLDQCRIEAADLVAAAESRARTIEERTDQLVRRAHGVADAGVARRLHELLTNTPAQSPEDPSPAPPDTLDWAIAILAHEILGAPRGSGP